MPPPSNNKLILKIAFVVLFLVLLGELGYVFMTVNKKDIIINPVIPTVVPTNILFGKNNYSIPSPPADIRSCISCLNSSNSDTFELQSFNYFLEKKILNRSFIKIEFQGKIVELEIDKDNKPELYLSLQRNTEGIKEKFNMFLSGKAINDIAIANSENKILSYKDLKIGQNVKIVEVYDLLKKVYLSYVIFIID